MNGAAESEAIDTLEQFCSGFATRDAEAVMRLVAPGADLVVVTSEETLLRGTQELRQFLDRYVEGSTTYSWEWHRHDVSVAGPVAWLLAEGIEVVRRVGDDVERHSYRMTMVLERGALSWLVRQVHGSSPH